MRIAVFHELPFGGARDAVYSLSRGLVENNHSLDLYYVAGEKEPTEINFYKNIFFYKFVSRKWTGNDWQSKLYKDTVELYRLNRLHKLIANSIDSKKYDLVLVNGSEYIEAPFILKFLSTFKVFYSHDPNYRLVYEQILSVDRKLHPVKLYYEKINRVLRKYLDKQNLTKSDLILANSKFAKKIIKDTYNKDSELAYLGVDINLFRPILADKDIDIFYVGSYKPIDGFSLLEESYSSLTKKIKVKTIMYEDGWVSDKKQIRDFYNHSKIVVCLAHNEPFGLLPLESMASGIPVVAVNEGGYKETVVDGKTGFLINRNSNELAAKIKYLLDNNKVRKEMGDNARRTAIDKWSWEKRSKELSEILKKAKQK